MNCENDFFSKVKPAWNLLVIPGEITIGGCVYGLGWLACVIS